MGLGQLKRIGLSQRSKSKFELCGGATSFILRTTDALLSGLRSSVPTILLPASYMGLWVLLPSDLIFLGSVVGRLLVRVRGCCGRWWDCHFCRRLWIVFAVSPALVWVCLLSVSSCEAGFVAVMLFCSSGCSFGGFLFAADKILWVCCR